MSRSIEQRLALVEHILRLDVRVATWSCPVCGCWAIANEDRAPSEPHFLELRSGALRRRKTCPGRRTIVALSVTTNADRWAEVWP